MTGLKQQTEFDLEALETVIGRTLSTEQPTRHFLRHSFRRIAGPTSVREWCIPLSADARSTRIGREKADRGGRTGVCLIAISTDDRSVHATEEEKRKNSHEKTKSLYSG